MGFIRECGCRWPNLTTQRAEHILGVPFFRRLLATKRDEGGTMSSLNTANLLIGIGVPAALAAIVLIIGIAAANVPMIAVAVIVGILVGYLWVRRVRTDETTNTK